MGTKINLQIKQRNLYCEKNELIPCPFSVRIGFLAEKKSASEADVNNMGCKIDILKVDDTCL